MKKERLKTVPTLATSHVIINTMQKTLYPVVGFLESKAHTGSFLNENKDFKLMTIDDFYEHTKKYNFETNSDSNFKN